MEEGGKGVLIKSAANCAYCQRSKETVVASQLFVFCAKSFVWGFFSKDKRDYCLLILNRGKV